MLFSSMTFLWLFLPLVFGIYLVVPKNYKNVLLLLASLLFYSWGEPVYIFLMLFSIFANYFLAILIDKKRKASRFLLIIAVVLNVGMLWYFKYFSNFVSIVNTIMHHEVIAPKTIALPIGISFYTFQILSYVIDVYREECEIQTNLLDFALYVSFFPQLIAGPIVKYKEIAKQIKDRKNDYETVAYGIRRFIYGLSKKVIISNNIASVADSIYAIDVNKVGSKWLWVAALWYTLQMYYDFSGYSDMAIGLGRMFGFSFSENFDYPYVACSIQEFWRRWHISLSSWFKDYVYIPLGGNRKGRLRTYINLSLVFIVTGIWHGATMNFLLWGCFHGAFQLLERAGIGKALSRNKYKFINHIYTMFVVTTGWVIFRCDSLKQALKLLLKMFWWKSSTLYMWYDFFSIRSIVIILIAILLVGFVQDKNSKIRSYLYSKRKISVREAIAHGILLLICMILLIGGQYNPFIYFKF